MPDEDLISFARRLAATPSVSGQEQAAVQATAEELKRLGFERVEIDEIGNCIGTIGEGEGPRLIIDGHIDSIPLHSESAWSVDPFGGCVVDGRLYGLGICDQKGSIAAAAHGIAAAARSLGKLAGSVTLVASVNEESAEGAALQPVVERLRPTLAITSEPSGTRLCIGQRGRAKIEVTVTGRPCHAGHARLGLNAAHALSALIVEVSALEHPVHPRLGGRDITCIDILSSPYPSVSTVPGQAVARLDCRFLPGESEESLLGCIAEAAQRAWASWPEKPSLEIEVVQAEFSTWTGQHLSSREIEPAWWTDQDSPLVEQVGRALLRAGLDPEPTFYSFCTNGSYLAGVAGIPTIGFGVGEEHVAHQIDEHITLESLRAGARGYAAIVAELLGGS